jgi:hypothetical protein
MPGVRADRNHHNVAAMRPISAHIVSPRPAGTVRYCGALLMHPITPLRRRLSDTLGGRVTSHLIHRRTHRSAPALGGEARRIGRDYRLPRSAPNGVLTTVDNTGRLVE